MKITSAPVISPLHRAIYSTLATQSLKFSGYPYATVIPNVLDAHHQPILLTIGYFRFPRGMRDLSLYKIVKP